MLPTLLLLLFPVNGAYISLTFPAYEEDMGMAETYTTERAAQARVRQLRAAGVWPGIIRLGDGRFRLTCDPDPDQAHRPAAEKED
jgi:hypothetical protein